MNKKQLYILVESAVKEAKEDAVLNMKVENIKRKIKWDTLDFIGKANILWRMVKENKIDFKMFMIFIKEIK